MKVEMGPNLDCTSDKIARDSNKVLVGGEMMSRTWRTSNEAVEGRMVIVYIKSCTRYLMPEFPMTKSL